MKTGRKDVISVLNVAIVEEDYVYTEYLKRLLLQWSDKKTKLKIFVFLNGNELLNASVLEYDIIFMDLSPNQPDGILAAEELRNRGYQNLLILTSLSKDRACEGYHVNAYRYYLKPILGENINECMNYTLNQKVNLFFQYTYHGVTERIAFCDIICFESIQHYIDIHTLNRRIHIKGVLREILEQCPAHFLRCQRSYIVNMHYVMMKKGTYLHLTTGKIINISPSYLKTISDAMKN